MPFTMFNKDLKCNLINFTYLFIYLVCSTTLIQSANMYGIMSYCLSYGLSYGLSYSLTERRTACVFPGGGGCRCPPGTSGQEGRHPESGRHHNHCTCCLFLNTVLCCSGTCVLIYIDLLMWTKWASVSDDSLLVICMFFRAQTQGVLHWIWTANQSTADKGNGRKKLTFS